MSKIPVTITNGQVVNLHHALSILSALPIEPKLRYCIARNRREIQEAFDAINETLGPLPAIPAPLSNEDANNAPKSAEHTLAVSGYRTSVLEREKKFEELSKDDVALDLYLYQHIPEFDDTITFPSDPIARARQNQAIMEAILPMIQNET